MKLNYYQITFAFFLVNTINSMEHYSLKCSPVSLSVLTTIHAIYKKHNCLDQVTNIIFCVSYNEMMLPESAIDSQGNINNGYKGKIRSVLGHTNTIDYVVTISPALNKIINSTEIIQENNFSIGFPKVLAVYEFLNMLGHKNFKSLSSENKKNYTVHTFANKFAIKTMFTDELIIFKKDLKNSTDWSTEVNILDYVKKELKKRIRPININITNITIN